MPKPACGIAHSHSGRICALLTARLTRRFVPTGVRIATSSMVLEYTNGSAPFGPSTLSVQLLEPNLMNKTVWRWGDSTEGNLYGTFHTYDQLNGFQVTTRLGQRRSVMAHRGVECQLAMVASQLRLCCR